MKNILITGGAGYVGSKLVPLLLKNNYNVIVYDLMIYGSDVINEHPNLKMIKGDIRDINYLSEFIKVSECVIHLACISNDPSFELNPSLGKSINLDCFEPMLKSCIKNSIERFIYASSSSVYGVKSDPEVHEELSLEPLTDYSKFKAECETILSKYQSDKFTTITIRPATVCGYAPRQRLDVVVNILTNLAYHKNEITVLGGDQLRPNIHIDDMAEAYLTLLKADKNDVAGEIFNAGYENFSILDIAHMVKKNIGPKVNIIKKISNDDRSYKISSSKIYKKLNFMPKKTIEDAVIDLVKAFQNGDLQNTLNSDKYFNIKRMQKIDLK